MKTYLIYKDLTDHGGAERLVCKELEILNLLALGKTYLIVRSTKPEILNSYSVDKSKLIILSGGQLMFIFKLFFFMVRNRKCFYLCSSGELSVYLASIFSNARFGLHIHHPNYMSYNDIDKFSWYAQRVRHKYLCLSFAKNEFIQFYKAINFKQRVSLNLKSTLSLLAKKKSQINFVLSHYARREKQDIYGINCIVAQGAINKVNYSQISERTESKKCTKLFTIARLDKNKRLDLVVRAACELEHITELHIIGDGPELERLNSIVAQYNCLHKVHFWGYQPDELVSEITNACDLFVSIDMADYKLTMFESLNQGIPVLVSEETEVSISLIDTGYVFTCKPNLNDIKEKLKKINDFPTPINNDLLTKELEKNVGSHIFNLYISP